MTQEKLYEILKEHGLRLKNESGSLANLSRANLSGVDLSGADLSKADLRWADLRWADLSRANLSGADFSGARNLKSTVDFMETYFERTADGYIAYKTFNEVYQKPDGWKLKPGAVLTENVNFNRTEECGCGINVAPLAWVKREYKGEIWKVLIRWEWLCGVCCPYMSDGNIRCERVEIVEVMK